MLSKTEIKFIQALQQKKVRHEQELFLVEGIKIVSELLKSDFSIHSIYAKEEWIQRNESIAKDLNYKLVNNEELSKISGLSTANEVLAVVHMKNVGLDFTKLQNSLTFALDTVQDPGNFGTLIRIADWFGVTTIVCSENTVDLYNPKVIQATMGSFLRSSVYYENLIDIIKFADEKEIPTYAAVLDGDNIYSQSLSENGILFFGNESKGISDEIASLVKRKLSIPSFSASSADSLNVAIAAALFSSEFRRKRWQS